MYFGPNADDFFKWEKNFEEMMNENSARWFFLQLFVTPSLWVWNARRHETSTGWKVTTLTCGRRSKKTVRIPSSGPCQRMGGDEGVLRASPSRQTQITNYLMDIYLDDFSKILTDPMFDVWLRVSFLVLINNCTQIEVALSKVVRKS